MQDSWRRSSQSVYKYTYIKLRLRWISLTCLDSYLLIYLQKRTNWFDLNISKQLRDNYKSVKPQHTDRTALTPTQASWWGGGAPVQTQFKNTTLLILSTCQHKHKRHRHTIRTSAKHSLWTCGFSINLIHPNRINAGDYMVVYWWRPDPTADWQRPGPDEDQPTLKTSE